MFSAYNISPVTYEDVGTRKEVSVVSHAWLRGSTKNARCMSSRSSKSTPRRTRCLAQNLTALYLCFASLLCPLAFQRRSTVRGCCRRRCPAPPKSSRGSAPTRAGSTGGAGQGTRGRGRRVRRTHDRDERLALQESRSGLSRSQSQRDAYGELKKAGFEISAGVKNLDPVYNTFVGERYITARTCPRRS